MSSESAAYQLQLELAEGLLFGACSSRHGYDITLGFVAPCGLSAQQRTLVIPVGTWEQGSSS